MTTLVPANDQVLQEGSFDEEDDETYSRDSESESSECEGEGPINNDVVTEGGEINSTSNVGVSSATVSSMTITLADAPIMTSDKAITSYDAPITSIDGARVGEGSTSNNIVRVPPEKRSLYKFGQRTSNFRGVTRHRWTGKYEAHLWDNSTVTEGRKRKGKQDLLLYRFVRTIFLIIFLFSAYHGNDLGWICFDYCSSVYLGGYETESKAAQIYDLAALKYWGANANTKLNFPPISNYEREIEEMQKMSREEYVNSLRRNSICFTRGCSVYRGVTRQNVGRRWQARIGRVAGGKDIYLGTYDTEEEAAEAYDIAAVKLRGMNAITNFHISNYYKEGTKELDVIPIKNMEESSTLKIRYFKLT